ncbi:MAG: cysteine--tRNA ligase [Candidatus Omnitrophica bacterium]|nr:cysteine--tRNA ligase [Candidatus Omnitrophota bacterium]
MQIYNSLTKKKEDFVPLEGKTVRMYTCGVTVYDQCHIGHARSLYVFDVIRRYLKFRGYDVHFVRNITDVDDKIIAKALETNRTSQQVSDEQIASYDEDMKLLGLEPGDVEPRATQNIPDMIADIRGLMEKGYAYAVGGPASPAGGDVYFNVHAFKDYGKLSGQGIDKMMEAVRIEKDSGKKDPLDFALWKSSKPGEPAWDSPWGRGRPGWHIECSCMSMKHLKTQTLDIHAGGRDLIFPHHENEIAQSEALTGKTFAKYWIHHGLLTIDGHKMSKSSGNFITIRDAVVQYSADELKLFFLFSHYASTIDFTGEKMQEARKALGRFDILFWKASELLKDKDVEPCQDGPACRQAGFITAHKEEFLKAMDDDFNTPKAMAALFNLLNDTNKFIDENKKDLHYLGVIYHAVDILENFARNIFGLFLKEKEKPLSQDLKKLLDERLAARAAKDFKRSDRLRDLLKDKGIAVEDTQAGQTWRWI